MGVDGTILGKQREGFFLNEYDPDPCYEKETTGQERPAVYFY
jgi:hypothetical protein